MTQPTLIIRNYPDATNPFMRVQLGYHQSCTVFGVACVKFHLVGFGDSLAKAQFMAGVSGMPIPEGLP